MPPDTLDLRSTRLVASWSCDSTGKVLTGVAEVVVGGAVMYQRTWLKGELPESVADAAALMHKHLTDAQAALRNGIALPRPPTRPRWRR